MPSGAAVSPNGTLAPDSAGIELGEFGRHSATSAGRSPSPQLQDATFRPVSRARRTYGEGVDANVVHGAKHADNHATRPFNVTFPPTKSIHLWDRISIFVCYVASRVYSILFL